MHEAHEMVLTDEQTGDNFGIEGGVAPWTPKR